MKEIALLLKQLRNYPPNFFVYPNPLGREGLPPTIGIDSNTREGLVVCDVDKEEMGFIELGGQREIKIN